MSEGGYGPPPNPGWSPPPGGEQAPYFHRPEPKRKRFGFVALFAAFAAGGVLATIVTGVALFLVASTLTDGAVSATHDGAAEGVETIQEGDCVTASPDDVDVNSTDEVVPCDRLHATEVVGVVEVPGSRRWPSKDSRNLFVASACELAFESYVDVGVLDTSLRYTAIAPTLEAARDGDRRVYCLVYSEDYRGGFGSVEDSGF